MTCPQYYRLITIASVALLFAAGCTRIQTVEEYDGAKALPRPTAVLVKDFAYSPESIRLNSGLFAKMERKFEHRNTTEQERLLGQSVSEALTGKLVEKLRDLGMNAQRFDENPEPSGDYVLIEGQLTTVDQGNRAARMLIGLGFGESVVRTYCQVYDVSGAEPVLAEEFTTEAHSVRKPGAAETMGVGAVAGSLATAAAVNAGSDVAGETLGAGVEEEAERTARDLVDKMQPFFARQGWIPPD